MLQLLPGMTRDIRRVNPSCVSIHEPLLSVTEDPFLYPPLISIRALV